MAMEMTEQGVVSPVRPAVKPDVQARDDLFRTWPKITLRGGILVVLIVGMYVWGVYGTNVQPGEFIRGLPSIANFFIRLMPPAFDLQPVADLPVNVRLPFTIVGTSIEEQEALANIDPNATMPDWYKEAAAEADGSSPAAASSTDTSAPATSDAVPSEQAPAQPALKKDQPWFLWQPSTINKIFLPAVVPAVIQTLQMAIIGTTLSIFLAIPFGLLGARNISPHPALYQVTRFFMNIIRAIPELIIALVFVAAVGLGPFGGVMALAIAAIGSIARLYAESIEQIDPQQVMAIRATGGSGMQVFTFGVIPQVMPLVTSYSLSLFEHNLRAASILGLVGAGGVGFLLSKYMALFEYQQLMGAVIILVITVTVVDRLSARMRKAII
jgi:phosphonate transport system permease protein